MIRSIIQFSVRNKLIIGLLIVLWVAWGLWSLQGLHVGTVPDISNNTVEVITVSQNLATEEMEQYVTYAVETEMQNLPGLKNIRSTTRFGLSVVTLIFEDEMGRYKPRQLVAERLGRLQDEIPESAGQPFMGPITTGLGNIFQYTLQVKPEADTTYSLRELRTIQDWLIKRQMTLIEGVEGVNSFGGKLKQYEVAVNPERLKAMNLTMLDVFRAVEQNNTNTGGAYIDRGKSSYFIRGEGLAESLDDLRQTVVAKREGTPLFVRDVATVQYGHLPRYGAMTQGGEGETVGGIVMLLKGANANDVIQRAKQRLAEIEQTLPKGLTIRPFLDRGELIARTTGTITENLVLGGLIVIFVMVLIMGNWRGGLITASVIPLAMLFAFGMMRTFGVTANLMSLGAIDFGILIDGAVIIVEAAVFTITARLGGLKRVLSQTEADAIVEQSGTNMMRSAFFGQLIILIVYLPVLTLEGVEGKMFTPMALTIGFALLGVILLCLTYVPMMAALVLRRGGSQEFRLSRWLMRQLGRAYSWAVEGVLRYRWLTLATALLVALAAGITFSRLGGTFIPTLGEGSMLINARQRPGTSLNETIESTTQLEQLLLKHFPQEIQSVQSKMGVPAIPTHPMPMNFADILVDLAPQDEWRFGTKTALEDSMRRVLQAVPGVGLSFSQPIEHTFNVMLTGVRQDIAVKLYGDDLQTLAQKAEAIEAVARKVPGVAGTQLEQSTGQPQIHVRFQREQLAQYGIDISTASRVLQTGFSGAKAGRMFEGQRRFDLVVRLQEPYRENLQHVRNLYLPTPGGEQIPLREVADISLQTGPSQISRERTRRYTFLGVNVGSGGDVKTVVQQLRQQVRAQVELPPGYRIEYGGQYENFQRARGRLLLLVPLALLLIFMLLYFSLRSFSDTLLIFLAVPLAGVGGVFSLALRDMPFSISAGVGFIALFGVAVLNGLVLMNRFNELHREGVTALGERIRRATRERLRPILLTALTDILGFLPMAVSTSAGAEVQRPLATVVIGGILTAMLFTLLVLPVLYDFVQRWRSGGPGAAAATVASAGLLLLLAAPLPSQAQDNATPQGPLTLEAARERALAQHPAVEAAALQTRRQRALQRASFDPPNTLLYNSASETQTPTADGVFSVIGFQQSIDFPGAYTAQRKLQEARTARAEAQQKLTRAELLQGVDLAYEQLRYARARLRLARRLDSLFQRFEEAAEQRYQTGETNVLSQLSARNQAQAAGVRVQQARADLRTGRQVLGRWLNADGPVRIADTALRRRRLPHDTASAVEEHPRLALRQRQIATQEAARRRQKMQWYPGLRLNAGYQTVQGEAGFFTYQLGISLPLCAPAQKAKQEAAELAVTRAEAQYNRQRLQLERRYRRLRGRRRKLAETLRLYREERLPLARRQLRAAEQSYQAGQINYIAYVQNTQQALQTRLQYLDYLLRHNRRVIRLRYLMPLR